MLEVIKHLKRTADLGLNFVPLDPESVKPMMFLDASSENARGLKRHLGFLLRMIDGRKKANVIHYGSRRCYSVTWSVLASEIHALVQDFDEYFVLQNITEQLFWRKTDIEAFID